MADAESSNRARLALMELANMISVPMSLNAIVRLNVPDAIWQGGLNSPLSAAQILGRRSPPADDGGPENLQRFLRLLSSYGVFAEHISADGDRLYSLTEIGRTLATDADGLTYGPYVLQHHQEELMRAFGLAHETVTDPSSDPFVKANGAPAYAYYCKRPEMNALMVRAMSGVSAFFMRAILDGYDGFEGVRCLVDVGGSAGDSLRMIMQKHPTITQGINFDLPEVVAKAPHIPGVKHVGGDMFKSIPPGDAIFLKWALNWGNDECEQILKNCYAALPPGGKLIVCEPVIPNESDDSHRTRALLEANVFVMCMYKGQNHTEDEFRQIGLSAGFPSCQAFYVDYYYTILEFRKPST